MTDITLKHDITFTMLGIIVRDTTDTIKIKAPVLGGKDTPSPPHVRYD